MMRRAAGTIVCLALFVSMAAGRSWGQADTGYRYIAHLKIALDGNVYFDLFESFSGSPGVVCSGADNRTFIITCTPPRDPDRPPLPGTSPTPGCIAAANRMAGMVQAAKLAGWRVNVVHRSCLVEAIEYFQQE